MLKSHPQPRRETIFPFAVTGIIGAFVIIILKLSAMQNVIGLSLCLLLAAASTKIRSTNLDLASMTKKVLVFLSVVFLITLLFTPNIRAAAITEYYLPPGSTQPYGITFEPTTTGTPPYNVWFAEFGSSKIARKLTANTFTDTLEFQLPSGSKPVGIAYEECGYHRIWFTESQRDRIGVIPKNFNSAPWVPFNLTEYVLISGTDPHGIAVQPNAVAREKPYVWFAEYGRHAIGRLDVNASAPPLIVEWFLPDVNARPEGILYLSGRGIWFTEVVGDRIGYLSLDGSRLKEWPLISGSFPHSLANDTFGNIWFTESGRNRIAKLNPYTNIITEYTIPTANAQPFGIQVDPSNNVWFAEHGTGKIGRLTPGSNVIVEFTRKGGGAWDIQAASDGKIWFSDDIGHSIGRVDPAVATTSLTVPAVSTMSPVSSTATTLGTSTAVTGTVFSTVTTELFVSTSTSPGNTFTNASSVRTTSMTSYSASETSSIIRTSSMAATTSYTTQSLPTTVTSTSYVTTTTGTTSVTGTVTSTSHQTMTFTSTSTHTSYLATTTGTQTVTTTTTVTSTTFTFSVAAHVGMVKSIASGGSFALLSSLVAFGSFGGIGRRLGSALGRKARKIRWKTLGIGLFFLAMLATMILPSRGAAFTEWNLQYGSTAPYGLVFDDQTPANLWFAEYGSDRIGRLDPGSSEIREILLPANSRPWEIAFETARKELWFTESGRNMIGRITSYGAGSVVEFPLNTMFGTGYSEGPRGVAVQENVNGTDKPYIWVAWYGGDSILRVDPYDVYQVTRWQLPSSSGPQSIIFSNDVGIWFTEYLSGRIGNLNPTTGIVREWKMATDSKPWDLATDSKNNVWYTDQGRNTISKLNPYSGDVIEYRVPSSGSQPYGIVIDSRGWVWFGEHGLNRIGRFVPDDGTFTEYQRPTGVSVWDVTRQPGSNIIWFGDDAANRLGRFDSSVAITSKITDTISTAATSRTTLSPTSIMTPAPASVTTSFTDAPTTVSYATTTSTTSYQVTESANVLFTTLTATNTVYTSETLVVVGTSTSYYSSTVGTQTSTTTSTSTLTQSADTTTYATSTSTATATATSTATVTVTTGFGATGIPGFPFESIIAGIGLGAALLVALSRRKRTKT